MKLEFDVYFQGEILPDHDPEKVKQNIARLFKLPENKAEQLFSGKAIRIKSKVDAEKASKLRKKFQQAGAIIHIVEAGEAFPPPKPKKKAKKQEWKLMKPGSRLPQLPRFDHLVQIDEQKLAQYELAPLSPLPTPEPPPPPQIDIEDWQAEQAPLDDCIIEKEPVIIPDISHLKIRD